MANIIWDHGEMTEPSRLPTLFIPHGGGPCFFMDVPPPLPRDLWDNMAAYLRGIAPSLAARPKAVLIISGHWETEVPTVNAASAHSLYFDYYGFPEHTYRLTYPVKGSPDLAARVRDLLGQRRHRFRHGDEPGAGPRRLRSAEAGLSRCGYSAGAIVVATRSGRRSPFADRPGVAAAARRRRADRRLRHELSQYAQHPRSRTRRCGIQQVRRLADGCRHRPRCADAP